MDIGGWLRSLGLERYETTFRENEITEKVLPNLTAEDLKDLGVTIVGHRRILLDAIAVLRIGANAKAPPAEASPTIANARDSGAERRQVTVMFSDLVGSTALSARMDPEDLREVISAYQQCVAEVVQHSGGFVAKYMGDGVLIYFGYPQAHEDDAERAVRAGLELVAAVGALKTHAPLQTRVGIATGLVVVGDLIGSGASQEQAIVGETPNLAARLQGVARPNSVVIGESTRKLVGNLFELEDLGAQDLKGISGPVSAWAAVRPASIESRFEALHASGLTELVGREEELEILLRRWSKSKNSEGQVVLVSGEPGIGKSRLAAALMERIASEPHTHLRYFCSPQHTDSALYPIISQMERAAGFAHDDTAQAKLDKLDALLARSFTPPQDAALLAEMLSLPNDGRHRKLELVPQQRRQKSLEALTTQLELLARSNPVLMIFEDVHWLDPSSLEVLSRTVDRLRTLRVLLIMTHRPEFEPPWLGRPHVTALNLNRLGDRDIAELIDQVTGSKSLPESVRRDIIERTDGIPLFVEEMTRAVLETANPGDAGKTVAAVPPPVLAVPASLHASLMARLDRLGTAKEVAQIGAVIGREFSYPVLAAVALKDEKAFQSALEVLTEAGLLVPAGRAPNASYVFKHALVQDVAYGTLLREPRRALHARIAETLESKFSEIADNQPEVLARHCTEAGLIEKAARLWGKAGQWSLEHSALVEAAEQLQRALHQISTLPITTALRREQIKLQIGLMTALVNLKGYAALETKAAEERALSLIQEAEALGEPPEDPLLLFSVLHGVWWANYVALNGMVMRELAAQLLGLAEKRGATTPLMIGHRVMGNSLLHAGNIAECRVHFDHAIAFYDPGEHRSLVTRFGQDMKVIVLSWRALALWLLGYPEAALADANEAIRYAREIGHAATLMYALAIAPLVMVARGDYATARQLSDEVIALAEEKRALFWKVFGMRLQGQCLAMTGRANEAIEVLVSTADAYRSTGSTALVPLDQLYFATAYAGLGQFAQARSCIDEATAALRKNKDSLWEAEVLRMTGEVACNSSEANASQAEAYFERALSVARQQQAKSWELRAAMSLARLWRDQGKLQQARELLAPVYGWFTEGFDTRDLKEVKALLDELA